MGKRESKSAQGKDLRDPANAGCAKGLDAGGKICSQCGEQKPTADFYSKGTRLDSCCKECKKGARNARYISKEGEEGAKQIAQIVNLLKEHQSDDIVSFNARLEEFIRCAS
jgi:hypothetical protein